MRRIAIAPIVGILLAGLTSTVAATNAGTNACDSAAPCLSGINSAPSGSSGAGVKGMATNGYGVRGISTTSNGVFGQSNSGSILYPGVEGESFNNNGDDVAGGFGISGSTPNYGVYALGSTFAVFGKTTTKPSDTTPVAYGILGQDAATQAGNVGALGLSRYGTGVYAQSGSNARTVFAYGAGLVAQNDNQKGVGLAVIGSDNVYLEDTSTDELIDDSEGNFSVNNLGAVSATQLALSRYNTQDGSTQYVSADFDADQTGTLLVGNYTPANSTQGHGFTFDNLGDETLDGMLTTSKSTYSRTRGASGAEKIAYGTRSTSPTIDDVGGGQLTQGSAYVRLDSALADVIDRRSEYRVFITPDGESNQLYVTQKSPTGFVVREAHGGRSNIAFDYRIVAKPFDDDSRRLATAPVERRFTPSANSATGLQSPAALKAQIVASHRNMFYALGERSRIIDPFDQLKARLGPAKFAAAYAEFKRQQRH